MSLHYITIYYARVLGVDWGCAGFRHLLAKGLGHLSGSRNLYYDYTVLYHVISYHIITCYSIV